MRLDTLISSLQYTSCFNSRTPGGVRPPHQGWRSFLQCVSIHAPREGCDYEEWQKLAERYEVSIHAPREGCDRLRRQSAVATCCFNSRTPGGVRQGRRDIKTVVRMFQFTHPGRGATRSQKRSFKRSLFQFTHPGRGATRIRSLSACDTSVSIHAPREGCDPRRNIPITGACEFQFTHPGRGATRRYAARQRH